MQRQKPCYILILLALLLGSTFGPHIVQAGQAPTIRYSYTYAQSATFDLILPAGEAAREATFYLSINDAPPESYTLPIEEGRAIYQRDLRSAPFPPFARLTYWWEYTTATGLQRTEKRSFLYEDNRFSWATESEDGITVKWPAANTEQLLTALKIARESREAISEQLQVPAVEPITLYIYPSLADLQLALRLSGESWVGGEARPEVGVILLAAPPTDEAALRLQRDIPHEMTHMLLYRKLGASGYAMLPTWLNEGLATHFEQRPDASYAVALEKAISAGTIFHLEQLCRPFYDLPDDRVRLAYAESGSIVNYIRQTYGWSAIRSLLDAYDDGLSCENGVRHVLGIDLGTLERQWLKWYGERQGELTVASGTSLVMRVILLQLAPWLTLLAILMMPLAFTLFHRFTLH